MWLWDRSSFQKLEQLQFIRLPNILASVCVASVCSSGTSVQMTSASFFWNTIFFQRRVPLLSGKSLPDAASITIWKYEFVFFNFQCFVPLGFSHFPSDCEKESVGHQKHTQRTFRPQQTLSQDGVLAGAVCKSEIGTFSYIYLGFIQFLESGNQQLCVCGRILRWRRSSQSGKWGRSRVTFKPHFYRPTQTHNRDPAHVMESLMEVVLSLTLSPVGPVSLHFQKNSIFNVSFTRQNHKRKLGPVRRPNHMWVGGGTKPAVISVSHSPCLSLRLHNTEFWHLLKFAGEDV